MKIAFYAPMKPPGHPVPSGDRRMARPLIEALRRGGHEVRLASRLRSWDPGVDPARPARIEALGARIAERLIRRWRGGDRPDIWFTYHLYHKAPDWLGPPVAAALGIPYVAAEASHAPRRAEGPWAAGHRAAEAAIRRAAALVTFSDRDAAGLSALVPAERIVRLPPFLDAAPFAALTRRPADPPRLIAIGMMREGDKERSYALLADALRRLGDRPWTLTVVGDGPARSRIERLYDPARTVFRGAVPPESLPEVMAETDLFVWPAINEAFGMALLEAQAAGLPAVAGAAGGESGGVAAILRDGGTGLLVPPDNAGAFADAVAALLDDPARRRAMGEAARANVLARHDIAAAAAILDRTLARVAAGQVPA
ncbi:glycosyltransferase family 4 protein [Inquilinus sp. Marseille-Q2685]|uniref:glycosyltransferase family 4 protein n=1 Tax=Inquilinus sp. Marseille-Q2685 TaxID=2866581 RepID=UPI001CE42837|nr:glycosyltransferase family 4 protein [Inquilinus sp. Marseille-Q2685]